MSEPMKASIKVVPKHYITCPYEDCKAEGEEGPGSVTHLLEYDTSFGPWYCNRCGKSITGNTKNGEVFINLHKEFYKPSYSLLKLDPLNQSFFIVVKDEIYSWDEDSPSDHSKLYEHKRYFYEEHTCPINYLRDIEVVIIGNDTDPHGLFDYLKTVPYPGEKTDINNMDIENLARLFNVEGSVIKRNKKLTSNETKLISSSTKEIDDEPTH